MLAAIAWSAHEIQLEILYLGRGLATMGIWMHKDSALYWQLPLRVHCPFEDATKRKRPTKKSPKTFPEFHVFIEKTGSNSLHCL